MTTEINEQTSFYDGVLIYLRVMEVEYEAIVRICLDPTFLNKSAPIITESFERFLDAFGKIFEIKNIVRDVQIKSK